MSAADPAATMPFAATMGILFPEAGPELVRARLSWNAALCTSGGALHGGVIMALGDSAGGLCAFLNLPPDATGTTTISSSTSFLRAVRTGAVEAVARAVHVGRTVVAVAVEIRDFEGRPVATMMQSQLVLRSGPGAEAPPAQPG